MTKTRQDSLGLLIEAWDSEPANHPGPCRDHRENHDDDPAAGSARAQDKEHQSAGRDADLQMQALDGRPPQELATERPFPDLPLIAVHGARSMFLTALTLAMTLGAAATAPPADLPWGLLATAWVACSTTAWLLNRRSASGGMIPIGTLGDSRFALAVIGAVGIGVTQADVAHTAHVPFGALLFAAALCGAADGAWTAMAMRHHTLTFVQALGAFLSAARSPGACSWRIVTGGPP